MKLILTFMTLLSFNTNAIVVKNCPSEIEVTLGEFEQASERPKWEYVEYEGEAKASYNYMKYMKEFSTTLMLKDTSFSRCKYSSDMATAVISGSTKVGAKNPAKLGLFWDVTLNGGVVASYEALVPLTDVMRSELTLKYPAGYAKVWHPAQHCNWGECGPSWLDLGQANLVEITVK